MNVDLRDASGVLVARLLGSRIDAAVSQSLKARIAERIEGGVSRVVLDLSDVEFVDSTGLGVFLSLLKRLPASGGLVLCGCRPPVAELVRLTRLDRVLKMAPGESEALKLFEA